MKNAKDGKNSALQPDALIAEAASGKKNVISSIRVPSERLDTLMSLVSELMTLQAKLGTLTDQNPQSELLGGYRKSGKNIHQA